QFQDSLSQLVRNSMMPQQASGGQNPAQVGLGVQVAGISTNFASGAPQPTGVPTNLMIAGDGFFVVRSGGETLYTRNGGFSFDASGKLVSADGALVQGWTAQGGTIVPGQGIGDRKSTRLNSSHVKISYAVFCLKKKNKERERI